MQRALAIAAIASACLTVALPAAAAEPVPGGTIEPPPPTDTVKELEGQGKFGTADERTEAEATDTLQWDLSFGLLLSTGNARMFAMNGSTNFLLRRDRHQLTAVALGNYGRAAAADAPTDAELETTLGNVQGRARYDIFLSKQWSLFAMATARHDPFQFLDLRLNLDPGVAWYVLITPKERLTVEAGYDFQLDLRNEDAVVRDAAGEPVLDDTGATMALARRRNTHAVRLAGGYVNTLDESVTFRTGLEYLQSVQDAVRWRINWDVGLTTTLLRSLALATTFTLRIDNDPLPGVREVDTVTALSLVYRFF
jgi:putative salt-induced outer membrane protein